MKTEFPGKNGGLDLEPSVYELNEEGDLHAQIVRACTEHAASLLHNPPNGGGGINLAGLCRTQPTPGRTAFDFTRTRHHEIQLESVEDLRALVQGALTNYESRKQPVARDEMLDYADARLAAEDAEWLDATKPGTQGHDWLPLIQKRKRQRG